ncbi:alpha/beta hydrolase [Siphonobacter sp. BAB-5385]|uniref:alpha/beta fold hydrolase n=1 Tax=unclassified Siphonobacter TaxID=2635712 RepID=UPI000B9E5DD4|nr:MULTISPECIES: alpha/beta hydrolase [unclassified Siphonobacter]OZI07939.1 alpha/beta hydrolase [Siphonobacter sp. BAB-5385]PMD91427.1 alpha/beta hydrolase [Siphonobacter sp. BAB-5405]
MPSVFVSSNGIQLHVRQEGPVDGPLILLLHGFPEFWYGWRHQITALAEAGFRVWVPDQRGYNLSDKPAGIQSYTLDKLAADMIGLIDAAGVEKATVVGHDWGGGVAWYLAMTYPERIHQLVILNMPHLAAFGEVLRRHPRQLLKSWYVGFFQVPWLPEWLAKRGKYWAIRRMLRLTSRPGTFTDEDLIEYQKAWSQPGPGGASAFRTMVHWYRAFVRHRPSVQHRVTVPTLILWGVRDSALIPELATASKAWCTNAELIYFKEATHWLAAEEPEAVTKWIIQKATA